MRQQLLARGVDSLNEEETQVLARCSHDLSVSLVALGQREEALGASREAVELNRDLALNRPDTFRPDLAMSLNNLGSDLSGLERRAEAVAAIREAVALLLPFFKRLPTAFANQMGNHLGNYLKLCRKTGQEPDAELITQALTAFQSLKTQSPDPPDS